ncbi:MAG TPA: sugar-binding protein, partial [Pyrinomonadaceae bacterium]
GANAQTPPAGGGSATGAPPPEKTNPVRIPRFEAAPVIDGRLDEEVWNGAARLKDFYQIEPGDNSTPSRATEVLLGYDARTLYLAFRAHDDPSKVRATIARRDAVSGDDHVGIYLDTYNDKRKAYSLYFNPYGIQADAVFTEGVGEDYSVDVVMQSKGVVGDGGYVVEVAIPFKSLRYEAGKDKLWGVHVFRFIKRFDDERDSWMPISRDKSGTLSQAGHLTGLEDLWAGRTLEVIPTLTFSQTGRRVRALTPAAVGADPTLQDPGRFINPAVEADPGVTARLHVTPTVVLDLTVNPDFAQVEADQLVVTANQRFPIFFQERRPFFIEGIDIFRTPLRPLHTRAIVDPDFAVKLTGKRGRNTFGFLAASDKAPGNFSEDERTDPSVRPSIERFLDKNAYVGVLRLKRDVGKESSLGLIATTYNFIEKHNHLGGFDGRLRLDEQSVFTFQVLGTTSRRFFRDADLGRSLYRTGNGFAYDFNYQKSGRNLYVELFGTGRTRDYRADVGFTPRTDTNNEGVYVRYRTTPKPKAKLISWSVENYAYANFDWRGRSQNWVEDFNVGFNFARQTSFHVAYVKNYERLFEEEFGPRRTATRQGAFFGPDPERTTNKESYFAYGETTPSKKYSASFDFVYTTDEFDFDFGAGPRFPRVSPAALLDPDAPLDPGPGNELRLKLELKYQPTDELNVTFEYTKDRLVRSDTKRLAFADNLYDLRATYQFTRFMFARARVDYTTLFSNVRGQFLFGWTPNPGTA